MTTVTKMMIGFTAGIVIGVLYAPAKGTKTREKLSRFGEDVKAGWGSIRDSIAGEVDDFRNRESMLGYNDLAEIEHYELRDSPAL